VKFSVEKLKLTKSWNDPKNQKLVRDAFSSVGAVETAKPKSDQGCAAQDRELESGKGGLGYRVTFYVHSRRKMDGHDNLRSALKPLVDTITSHLGFKSDDDERLEWEYHQIIAKEEGVLVKIQPTKTENLG
jgi:hypothetical protein